ncbi:hypothetical protein [Streptacidiphilus melanogenes]|uniref:hypothetical protein n=1 Tax=Streptacidiphilus melanogenes TaxID=411235 RepID=UPI000694544D|nr:hypothetical protein [Streptacidiphilus melanogenes]
METLTDRDFYPEWHDALVLLNRDLAATEPGTEPFALLLDEYGVFVGFPSWGAQGNPLREEEAGLPEVADAAQESAMEHLWRTWPVCPEHDLGLHVRLREEDGATVWWCAGRGPAGHGIVVGTLEARRTKGRRASKSGKNRRLGLR